MVVAIWAPTGKDKLGWNDFSGNNQPVKVDLQWHTWSSERKDWDVTSYPSSTYRAWYQIDGKGSWKELASKRSPEHKEATFSIAPLSGYTGDTSHVVQVKVDYKGKTYKAERRFIVVGKPPL
jgi:hypothetical protein